MALIEPSSAASAPAAARRPRESSNSLLRRERTKRAAKNPITPSASSASTHQRPSSVSRKEPPLGGAFTGVFLTGAGGGRCRRGLDRRSRSGLGLFGVAAGGAVGGSRRGRRCGRRGAGSPAGRRGRALLGGRLGLHARELLVLQLQQPLGLALAGLGGLLRGRRAALGAAVAAGAGGATFAAAGSDSDGVTSFRRPGFSVAAVGTGVERQAAYWRRISAEASDGETAAASEASGIRSTAPERSTFMFWRKAFGFA